MTTAYVQIPGLSSGGVSVAASGPVDVAQTSPTGNKGMSVGNPSNKTVVFASGLSVTSAKNAFSNTTLSSVPLVFVIPEGLDLSEPVEVDVHWCPDGVGAGDVEWVVRSFIAGVGDLLDVANAIVTTTAVATVALATRNTVHKTTILVDLSGAVVGDVVLFALGRNGPSLLDTFASSVYMLCAYVRGVS